MTPEHLMAFAAAALFIAGFLVGLALGLELGFRRAWDAPIRRRHRAMLLGNPEESARIETRALYTPNDRH